MHLLVQKQLWCFTAGRDPLQLRATVQGQHESGQGAVLLGLVHLVKEVNKTLKGFTDGFEVLVDMDPTVLKVRATPASVLLLSGLKLGGKKSLVLNCEISNLPCGHPDSPDYPTCM